MGIVLPTLISVIIVSLISLVGLLSIIVSGKNLKKLLVFFISFSAGSLFGGAFLHLLPEAAQALGFTLQLSSAVLTGIVFFYVLENFIHWRHCHIPTTHDHPHPVGTMSLVGDGLHNLIDGMVIAAAYLISIPAGIATTVAVAIHEIPQEIGDFGVLIHAGYSKGKALFLNFCSALLAIVGALMVLAVGAKSQLFANLLVPFTAGGFIYIAGADLIPELRKEVYPMSKLITQFVFFLAGIAIMLLLTFI
ncbi:MAG: ZIP family metal transporter [Nanoarchaeota archaeon]|nr:ZIP family metal transporter [Nanoarchaeota archaeon]